MNKILIQRGNLADEMKHAAKKRLSFQRFIKGLRIDYDTTPLEPKVKELEYQYNTLLFITESFKARYNTV